MAHLNEPARLGSSAEIAMGCTPAARQRLAEKSAPLPALASASLPGRMDRLPAVTYTVHASSQKRGEN
jgi:hypothetical protein